MVDESCAEGGERSLFCLSICKEEASCCPRLILNPQSVLTARKLDLASTMFPLHFGILV